MAREYRGRDALEADRDVLAVFSCPVGGDYCRDVEELVGELIDWRAKRDDRVVRVYDTHEAEVVAVLAYEDLVEGTPERGVFITAFAVREGFERQGSATNILTAFGLHLRGRSPDGYLVFRVDSTNVEMTAFCSKFGVGEPEICEQDRNFYEYSLSIQGE